MKGGALGCKNPPHNKTRVPPVSLGYCAMDVQRNLERHTVIDDKGLLVIADKILLAFRFCDDCKT